VPKDFPFEEARAGADKWINDGFDVYQKFTCEKCGQRLTMDVPNAFFTSGDCDKCGHVTDIAKRGCNYAAIGKVR
jgi:hypothetical protein